MDDVVGRRIAEDDDNGNVVTVHFVIKRLLMYLLYRNLLYVP